MIVTFDGIYDTAQVAADYRGLPGVVAAEAAPLGTGPAPLPPEGPADVPPRLCATDVAGTIHYVASGEPVIGPDSSSRPEIYYYFVSTSAGAVTLEDTYNAAANPFIQPAWASRYGDC